MKQVSIRGTSYLRLKEYCKKYDIPVSSLVDKICMDFFCPSKRKRYNHGEVNFRHILF